MFNTDGQRMLSAQRLVGTFIKAPDPSRLLDVPTLLLIKPITKARNHKVKQPFADGKGDAFVNISSELFHEFDVGEYSLSGWNTSVRAA